MVDEMDYDDYDEAEWRCPYCLTLLFAPWVKHSCPQETEVESEAQGGG